MTGVLPRGGRGTSVCERVTTVLGTGGISYRGMWTAVTTGVTGSPNVATCSVDHCWYSHCSVKCSSFSEPMCRHCSAHSPNTVTHLSDLDTRLTTVPCYKSETIHEYPFPVSHESGISQDVTNASLCSGLMLNNNDCSVQ